jgi:hypothetical protein
LCIAFPASGSSRVWKRGESAAAWWTKPFKAILVCCCSLLGDLLGVGVFVVCCWEQLLLLWRRESEGKPSLELQLLWLELELVFTDPPRSSLVVQKTDWSCCWWWWWWCWCCTCGTTTSLQLHSSPDVLLLQLGLEEEHGNLTAVRRVWGGGGGGSHSLDTKESAPDLMLFSSSHKNSSTSENLLLFLVGRRKSR